MSKESYIRGFCKAAEAHGIDPQALAKYATEGWVANEQDERKGGLEGNLDLYRVPLDAKGTTDWLGSTSPISVEDGAVSIPGGAASLTNSPAATVRIIDGGRTNNLPVWKPARTTLRDTLYGLHPYLPRDKEMERFLKYIATNGAPAKVSAPAKK